MSELKQKKFGGYISAKKGQDLHTMILTTYAMDKGTAAYDLEVACKIKYPEFEGFTDHKSSSADLIVEYEVE